MAASTFRIVIGTLLAAGAAGCGSGFSGPFAYPLTEGPGPEVASLDDTPTDVSGHALPGDDLPSFTSLSRETAARAGWLGRWEATWLLDPLVGWQRRMELYDEAVGSLVHELDSNRILESLELVLAAADEAERTEAARLPPFYQDRIDEARHVAEWGLRALEEGVRDEALRAALESADRLRGVDPERIARGLLTQARHARESMKAVLNATGERRDRIDRLISGAEAALEREDTRSALLRAYYACQLLDVDLP